MNSVPAELMSAASADLSILGRTAVGGAASGKEEVAAVYQEQVDVLIHERRLEAWKSLPRDMITGAILGGVAHTIVAPVERAKLLLQTQDSNVVIQNGKQARYKGLVDCIVRVAREEGFLSLWRGNGISVLRYYPSLAINFAMKDFYRTLLLEDRVVENENAPLSKAPVNFLAGAMAGCTSLVFVYPLDIAHTRLAADIGRNGARQFRGMVVHRSIYFGGFDTAKDVLSPENEHIPFWKRWAAAQGITTSAGLISYPLDTVRRRMMMQSGLEVKMYSNTLDCWKKIYKQEGPLAFYKGAVTNMVRGTGAALILVLYDELKRFMHWKVPMGVETRPPQA
ncbi:hypothetical protein R1flu_000891 [Riccia fluitans]|uniref:ADP/ATP translocase n=1 Tax=Riccia fluitans TaxID=41844 RepID=A0ABD1Y234_9MARC